MRVADYITKFIYDRGVKTIFTLTGGGIMYLTDALALNKEVKTVCLLHEQSVSLAVNGYALLNGFGACYVTTGPGAINALLGVAEAWIASVPCMFISGQAPLETCVFKDRILGVQQLDIIPMVKTITKYSVLIKDVKTVKYYLEEAYKIAIEGRPGPVWLDIPLDIQKAKMWGKMDGLVKNI